MQPLCGKLFTFTKTDKLFVCTIRSSFCNSCQISCPPNNILTLQVLVYLYRFLSNLQDLKSKLPNVFSPATLLDHRDRSLRIKMHIKLLERYRIQACLEDIRRKRTANALSRKLHVLHEVTQISNG